ncbi:MAG: autotransporter domain-containing protein [Microvirga sp.]|nr:autotransporter domain-containing protein [Microvirga sp.]
MIAGGRAPSIAGELGRVTIGKTSQSDASLTIRDGGVLENFESFVGDQAGSKGAVTLTGAGSAWTFIEDLYLGYLGVGEMTVTDGASFRARNSFLGEESGSTGIATASGSGTFWSTGWLNAGYRGHGEVTVSDGAVIVADYYVSAAEATNGTGVLTIESGAVIRGGVDYYGSYIAYGENGDGKVFVRSGGRWEAGPLYMGVGVGSAALIEIDDGGAVVASTVVADSSSTIRILGSSGARGALTTGEIARQTGDTLLFVDGGRLVASTSNPDFLKGFVDGAFSVGGGGAYVDTNGFNVGLNPGFGGSGALVKQGLGTLTIAGTASHAGGTVIEMGTLALSGGGSLPSTGGLVLQGGAFDISGASGARSVSDLSGSGSIQLGSNGLSFGTAVNTQFTGAISGSGDLTKVGSGTMTLGGDASLFSGAVTISGGTLAVNGTLGGSMNVSGAGALAGSGTVGATTVGAGGVVSPGNSIGTLTIDGDLTFGAGSVYRVEVDPSGTSSDLIVVNGVARLAGTVMHVGQDGAYRPQSEYRILTATGGFDGTTFDGVSSSYTFLSPLLAYGANDVRLTLERNQVAFASVATTPNQTATAGAIESLSAGNPIYDAVVKLDGPGAQDAFDQLSGEAHASDLAALIGGSGSVRGVVSQRFQPSFGVRGTASASPLDSYASYGDATIEGGRSAGLWGQAFGSWGRTSGDSSSAGVRRDDGGFLVGVDGALAETWNIGAFAGYSRSSFSVRDRNSSGSSDNFHLGLHGGAEIGALRLNVGAAHSWHDIDTRRTVAFPGFTDRLSASYRARTAQIFGEAGYRIDLGTFGAGSFGLEPFAGLAYVHTVADRFSETGGAAALTAAGSTSATTFSTLGLRAFSQFEAGGMQATLRGMLGWRHAFGDTTPTTRFAFAGGDAFSVSGAPIAKNAALVEAGLDLAIRENVTLGVSYDGQYSRRSQDHGFNARLRVAF